MEYKYITLIIKDVFSFGWYCALKGMRYPKNSEEQMDSVFSETKVDLIAIGEKDQKLLFNLIKAGKSHRKVLRMLHIQLSMKMPISFWIQYDTYKVATVSNSRSRMHTITKKLLNQTDFYIHNEVDDDTIKMIVNINNAINMYNDLLFEHEYEKAQVQWNFIIDHLPMAYLQERMIDISYETALAIILERYNEKLKSEWNFFIEILFESVPLIKEIAINGGFTYGNNQNT